MGWAGGGWTEGESRLSPALRIQNLMKIHRHTLASIDPCTQIHTSPPHPHLLTCWFSHTLTCACVGTTHRQAHSLHTPTHPYTHHSIHMCIPPQLPTPTLTGASSPHVLTHTHTHTLYTVYNTHALKHILAHIHTLPFTHPPTPSHDRPYTALHAHSYALT